MSNKAEIRIPVIGENANEIVEEFWSWFLDGGGEQMFFDVVDMNRSFSAMTKVDDDSNWYIEQIPKEDEEPIL